MIEDIRIRPVLNTPPDNGSERGENKSGANISLYSVSWLFKEQNCPVFLDFNFF